jgi:hypothetical protein
VTQKRPPEPFDETAALLELERLRESIEAARQARQQKTAEFDSFVKGFRKPPSTPDSERSIPTPPLSEPPQPASELISAPPPPVDPPSSTVVVPSNTDASGETTAATRPRVSRRSRINIRPLGIAAIVALAALGLLSTRWRKQTPPPNHANPVTNNQLSPGRGKAPTAAARQPAATVPPAAPGVVVELKTVRPVWMRVVVDGRKNIEGMVQAGEPLHLTGDRSIVVRVGNGGDVLVKTGDREDRFGEVGQPVTRTFSKP